MGVCPWSPLAGGFLTGKYRKEESGISGEGRMQSVKNSENPVFEKLTERNWKILDELLAVSKEIGKTLPDNPNPTHYFARNAG
jgi:aryl-alcohol dehydrogenase-like predicted oxidoreductase